MKGLNRKLLILGLLILLSGATGCLTFYTRNKDMRPQAYISGGKIYRDLGSSTGKSSSFTLFWWLPVTPRISIKRAIEDAISSKGGDNLINLRVWHERQFWILGTVDVIYVRGRVIRYVNE